MQARGGASLVFVMLHREVLTVGGGNVDVQRCRGVVLRAGGCSGGTMRVLSVKGGRIACSG